MIIYKYNEFTGEYEGKKEAYTDPLESKLQKRDVFIVPVGWTSIPPIEVTKEGYAVSYNREKREWEEKIDHRGKKVYDKKTGEEFIVDTIGELSSDFSFEKPVKIKELREEKIKKVKEEFIKQLNEKIKIGEIECSAFEWSKLAEKVNTPENYKLVPIFQNDDCIFVERDELNEAVKHLFIRCSLLSQRKKEILEEVNSLKGKKQLQEYVIDFDVNKELKKLMKLSVEELNEKFSEDE